MWRDRVDVSALGNDARVSLLRLVRDELELEIGDEILLIKEGDRILIENARKEIKA